MKRIFYFLCIVVALVACTDDDNFSSASGLRLTFSTDTVKMDTVFSKTPSATYTFWVHNDNDEGIRLQSVRLNKKNQTGFRVNVDGSWSKDYFYTCNSKKIGEKNESCLPSCHGCFQDGSKSPGNC